MNFWDSRFHKNSQIFKANRQRCTSAANVPQMIVSIIESHINMYLRTCLWLLFRLFSSCVKMDSVQSYFLIINNFFVNVQNEQPTKGHDHNINEVQPRLGEREIQQRIHDERGVAVVADDLSCIKNGAKKDWMQWRKVVQ